MILSTIFRRNWFTLIKWTNCPLTTDVTLQSFCCQKMVSIYSKRWRMDHFPYYDFLTNLGKWTHNILLKKKQYLYAVVFKAWWWWNHEKKKVTVQIWKTYFSLHIYILFGFDAKSQNDQLPESWINWQSTPPFSQKSWVPEKSTQP